MNIFIDSFPIAAIPLPNLITPSQIAANLQVQALSDSAYAKLTGLKFNFPANWGYDIFEEVYDEAMRKAAIAAEPANKISFTV
ncbi:hypothetical protein N7466_007249 [Penicillium verhagenii]|uniref:uncharacterized protein n=1 Tax=Penicillium verhagenii TaxID=1562060 RepID=UPI002545526A|nr:uncharacterized protein N7466_007249 [Penicillium verhagenii]KAJ5928293.1 hypothetical protein N7466_007249 [Penicillium verhagenii]